MQIRDFQNHRPKSIDIDLPSGSSVDVEIGCGNGRHPLKRAIEYPERTIIAIERTKQKFKGFETRIESHQRKHGVFENLYSINADAEDVLSGKNYRFDNIFLLYPNPYPKNAQRNKRWHYASFSDELMKMLNPGGRIHLATNMKWYAEEAKAAFKSRWNLDPEVERCLDKGFLKFARTNFEYKYLSRDEPCYDLIFRLLT